MTSLNNAQNSFPDFINAPVFIAEHREQKEKERAALAHLASVLQAVLKTVPEEEGSSEPQPAENASGAQPSSIPSDYQMQQFIGQLMALLTDLQGVIAKYGTQNSQNNASVGQALVTELQAQVQTAQNQLQKIIDQLKQQDFWSIFTKIAEAIVGVVISIIAVICLQPELAVITLAFTILAVSGGMDKITKGLGDALSSALVAMGVPKEEADVVGKVLADIIIIVASIVITALTCGGGAATTGEVIAEEGEEMAELGTSQATEDVTEAATEVVEEASESVGSKLTNFFKNVLNTIKTNNPFSKLPKVVNLMIVTAAQAIGSTNFGQDIMADVLVHMSDKKKKQELETTLGIIINILAALAGTGAGAAVAMGSSFTSFSNTAKPLMALTGLQLGAGLAQFSGEVGLGVTYGEQASYTEAQGQTQALVTLLQALVRMNNGQADAESKALGSEMKTWGQELAVLTRNINAAEAAVAHELQG